MVEEIKRGQEDTGLMIKHTPQQTPFSRHTPTHCLELSISELCHEAFRDREKKERIT
jgi:hypothetical protein